SKPRTRPGTEYFDGERVGSLVILRHWRPGDRFQPIGLERAAKLQDIFTNLRIPSERRRELLVATTAKGEIFWVEGVRIGEQFKLREGTKHRLQWGWQRL
ncbi:MAG: tRNA lysidine(34) synthetase TilS, partial [Limisphaerales bacterium]